MVDGPPGSGKTFSCVSWMVDILINSERPVVTNMTVKPAALGAIASYFDVGRVDLARAREFAKRIKIIGEEDIRHFWDLPFLRGAAVYFDELHLVFSSRDWKDAEQELTDFISEHRKGGMDFYMVSQSKKNILVDIRRMAEGCYFVRNSRKLSIMPDSFWSGYKWPIQFFILKYCPSEGGKMSIRKATDTSTVWPWWDRKLIFRGYESHEASADFPALQGSERLRSDSDDDYGVMSNIWKEAVGNVPQTAALLSIVGVVVASPWLIGAGMDYVQGGGVESEASGMAEDGKGSDGVGRVKSKRVGVSSGKDREGEQEGRSGGVPLERAVAMIREGRVEVDRAAVGVAGSSGNYCRVSPACWPSSARS